jgi:hypothetical protein
MGKISETILCAFCRLNRRIFVKKSIDWTNVLTAAIAAALLMFVIWQDADPRAVIFFVAFLAVAEVFVRLRWRMSLPCPHCGFDPLLYKLDREETVRRVKAKLDELRTNGRHLFKPQNPLAQLPVIQKKANADLRAPALDEAQSKKSAPRLLSRQV